MTKAQGIPRVRRGRETPSAAGDALDRVFENKAGRYELVRVEGELARYTFTNHYGRQTEAVMPTATWRRLQQRVPPKAVIC